MELMIEDSLSPLNAENVIKNFKLKNDSKSKAVIL